MTIGVITVSDTRSPLDDKSGPAAIAALEALGYRFFERRLVPDDVEVIRAAILELCPLCKGIFTTGGTGFGARDLTPEATIPLLERRADSLSELIRLRGLEHTALSHLSRGVSGIRGRTLIVNLPGSPNGARQGIEALANLLPSIFDQLEGWTAPAERS